MKKLLAVILCVAMLLPTLAMAASEYDVTEPITITWWHAVEEQQRPMLMVMVDEFNATNGMGITVDPVYIGSYSDLNTQFIAAQEGGVPALICANTSYPATYGRDGLCEVLDPYIEEYDYDVEDFGEGLVTTCSYDDEVICLPNQISTQVMYYNKTAAEAEGIEMPTTFDQMEAFLEKATIFNEDGTTKRYGTVFGGWDYWYHEMLYKNNGVQIVTEDGQTDVNSEKAIEITEKINSWIQKGYAYYAYGEGASSNMRQLFWDGGAFSVFHTSSLYNTYTTKVAESANPFEVGMAWLPGSEDGTSFKSEVGGNVVLIPAKASQAEKNAAWQFMMFITSPKWNLYWANCTGYFPTRASVTELEEYATYLEEKPAMKTVIDMSSWINPRNQHPAYDACGTAWRHAMAKIYNEGAPVKDTLDALAVEINELLGN